MGYQIEKVFTHLANVLSHHGRKYLFLTLSLIKSYLRQSLNRVS